jgi:hypothetical protein
VLLFLILEKEKTKTILSSRYTWIAVGSIMLLLVAGFLAVKDTSIVASFIDNLGDDGGILKNVGMAEYACIIKVLAYLCHIGNLTKIGRL